MQNYSAAVGAFYHVILSQLTFSLKIPIICSWSSMLTNRCLLLSQNNWCVSDVYVKLRMFKQIGE